MKSTPRRFSLSRSSSSASLQAAANDENDLNDSNHSSKSCRSTLSHVSDIFKRGGLGKSNHAPGGAGAAPPPLQVSYFQLGGRGSVDDSESDYDEDEDDALDNLLAEKAAAAFIAQYTQNSTIPKSTERSSSLSSALNLSQDPFKSGKGDDISESCTLATEDIDSESESVVSFSRRLSKIASPVRNRQAPQPKRISPERAESMPLRKRRSSKSGDGLIMKKTTTTATATRSPSVVLVFEINAAHDTIWIEPKDHDKERKHLELNIVPVGEKPYSATVVKSHKSKRRSLHHHHHRRESKSCGQI